MSARGHGRIYDAITECVGNTPLVRLRRVTEGCVADVVVKLEPARNRILAIGGNVRSTVGLKLLPAVVADEVGLRPDGGARPLFAHLKLQAAPIDSDALDGSPTMEAIGCGDRPLPVQLATAGIAAGGPDLARC